MERDAPQAHGAFCKIAIALTAEDFECYRVSATDSRRPALDPLDRS